MIGEARVRALRGATTVARDEASVIVEATARLVGDMLEHNEVAPDDIVSIIFTATPDLASEFPAAASRRLGISDVPLLCARELAVLGAMPRCIRVLMHVYTQKGPGDLRHVYLGQARELRADLAE